MATGLSDVPETRFTSLEDALRAGPSVEELILREVKVGAIPEAIGDLVNLRHLDLCGSSVRALPAAMGRLRALERLDLTANEIVRIDPALGGLPRLRELAVSTREKQIPQAFDVLFNLPSLEVLRLPSCQALEALPASLAAHPRLCALDLWLCRRLGGFPALVERIPHLRRLNLASTELAELPAHLDGLAELEELELADNPLAAIPPAFFELPLRALNLSDMPRLVLGPAIGLARTLETLDLRGLRAPLPPEIGALTALRSLTVANGACAVAPSFLAELRALEELDVSGNDLDALPDEVYALPKLRKIVCFDTGVGERVAELRARHPRIVFED